MAPGPRENGGATPAPSTSAPAGVLGLAAALRDHAAVHSDWASAHQPAVAVTGYDLDVSALHRDSEPHVAPSPRSFAAQRGPLPDGAHPATRGRVPGSRSLPGRVDLLALQARVGNAAVAALVQGHFGRLAVQRVMTSEKLHDIKHDGFFFKSVDKDFQAILDALDCYHALKLRQMDASVQLPVIQLAMEAWRNATSAKDDERMKRRRELITTLNADVAAEIAALDSAKRLRAECDEAVQQIEVELRRPPRVGHDHESLGELKDRFTRRNKLIQERIEDPGRHSADYVDGPIATKHTADLAGLEQALLGLMQAVAPEVMAEMNAGDRFNYRHNMPEGERVYRMPSATWLPEHPIAESPGRSPVLSFTSIGDPAEAVGDLFRSADQRVVIECTAAISICYFQAILRVIGERAFRRLFKGPIHIANSISDDLEPFLRRVELADSSHVRQGDWVYFLNHLDYGTLAPEGAFGGENTLAGDAGQYEGFGLERMTEVEMLRTLARETYMLTPLTSNKDNATHAANGARANKLLEHFPASELEEVVVELKNAKNVASYNIAVHTYNMLIGEVLSGSDADTLIAKFGIPGLGKRRGPMQDAKPTATPNVEIHRLDFHPIAGSFGAG